MPAAVVVEVAVNLSRRVAHAYQDGMRSLPPLASVVRLYDGILSRILMAGEAARRGDYETQFNETMVAAKIINGLSMSLDRSQGVELADSLHDTYGTLLHALMRTVGRKNTSERNERLVDAVKTMRNAWAEVAGLPLLPMPVVEPKVLEAEAAEAVAAT